MSALFDESGSLILPERPQTESQYSRPVNAFEERLPSWVGTNWGRGEETVFSHMRYTVEAHTLSVASRRRHDRAMPPKDRIHLLIQRHAGASTF